jgi:DNA-binding NtrC family response regulator
MSRQPAIEAGPTGVITALVLSPDDQDYVSLERIFKPGWNVISSGTVASALSILRKVPIPLVICDCDITSVTWGVALDRISLLPDPPLFIVTSRLADDYLWAEALNLGAWDVLAKPFDVDEVIRIVSSALQHWRDRHGVHTGRTAQRKAATGTDYLVVTGT